MILFLCVAGIVALLVAVRLLLSFGYSVSSLRRGPPGFEVKVDVQKASGAPAPEPMAGPTYSKRCWFTFPTRTQVEQPILWQMSRRFPDVSFDIRQASVQNEIGIMAVLLSGKEQEVNGAIEFMRSKGVTVEPIEKSIVEG